MYSIKDIFDVMKSKEKETGKSIIDSLTDSLAFLIMGVMGVGVIIGVVLTMILYLLL